MIPVPALASGIAFLSRLPRFLRNRLSTQDAGEVVSRRRGARAANAMDLIRTAAGGVYGPLFVHAGCEPKDAERLIETEGVEGALEQLYELGVYLSVDEFKGRLPVRRGSLSFQLDPDRLRNPRAAFHVPARSSGSRSEGTPVLFDLEFIRGCAANTCLFLESRGGGRWLKADWETPGAGARFRLLKLASFGAPPSAWFSQVDPDDASLSPVYRWSARAMRYGGMLAGVPFPSARYAPLHDPVPVVRWIRETLDRGEIPHINTFASSAVRLCKCAREAGVEIAGAQFTLMGEPVTDNRLAEIRRAGASAVARYGSIECGPIGYGCLDPEGADDVHILDDLHALVQAAGGGPESRLPERALLVTALHPRAPFLMLNVSMGDSGAMVRRQCGCQLERIGWCTHVRDIRSFEKLTAAGMTFLDSDVIRVLEETLPARFGGSATDYQLVEDDAGGEARLRLFVHPGVGPVDEHAVAEALLGALGSGSSIHRMMETVWRDAEVLRIERRPPYATRSGKILHLHSTTG